MEWAFRYPPPMEQDGHYVGQEEWWPGAAAMDAAGRVPDYRKSVGLRQLT